MNELIYNCILIRQGEIFLKGKNRKYFESLLLKNIKSKLKKYKCSFLHSRNRIYIENFNPHDINNIIDELIKTFGIISISPCIKTITNLQSFFEFANTIVPKEGSFRVTVKRADKTIKQTSTEIASDLGFKLLQANPNLKVDLNNYDFNLNVDIRENGFSYIFSKSISAVGGLPVGCSGKGALLLSGGIDSPVAGYFMAKRGLKLIGIHFHSFPYTSEAALQKVRDLAQILSNYNNGFELYVVPFTKIQLEIKKHCPEEYTITLMRRFMMRISERIAAINNINSIVTGESLGQVASQTISGLCSTDSVLSENTLVFRPLIGFDKEETINIAKKINSFDISILPHDDCCTLFVPNNPIIHPKLADVVKAESVLDIDNLVDSALEETLKEYIEI